MTRIKYLVTGGTGSLGNQLAQYLDGDMVVFSRDEFKQSVMKSRFPDLEYILGDVRNKESIERAIRKTSPDVIIHAAAMKRIEACEENPWECVKTNIIGAQNVVDLCIEYGIKAVGVSTDKAVEPVNVYGMCKAVQEKIFLNAGFNVVRYGNVLNSRGSVVPVWKENKERGEPLEIRDATATRFIITLEDAQKLIEEAVNSELEGHVFIPDCRSIDLQTLADCISRKQVYSELGDFEKKHEKLKRDVASNDVERITKEEMIDLLKSL